MLPLVAAKTSRPRMIRAGVDRAHLTRLLEEASGRPVTMVCAGAGWGKTMAVSAWAQARREPVAWLSLDPHDNDPQIFWAYVLAALRVAGAVTDDNPLADLGSVPADDAERGGRLAAGLARLPSGTVLVIDDVHEIDDADVLRELGRLLTRLPPALRVVLVGRAEPALRLHRLRAARQLAEIGAGHLSFTRDEAADLVAGHGLTLTGEELSTLVERTEGWAAGLQLSAAFLATHKGKATIADIAGDVRSVDDYLTEEVLADHTRRQRRFLLQTSICESLCAGLVNAITQGDDGQRTLEQMERDNTFVLRLGAKPLWFRYHHLLRDVLRHRLSLETPGTVPELHRRAARWHAANDSVLEALAHAVEAGDWPYVGRLVATSAGTLMVSAHRAALVRILRAIPAERLHATPELMICAALLLFHAGDYDAIPARLDAARTLLRTRPSGPREPVEIMAYGLQLAADRAAGDMPAVIAGSGRLLDLLAVARSAPAPALAQGRAIALNNRGLALMWTGRPDEAERDLWAGSSAARSAGVELTEINATGHLALLQAMHGSVHEAARLADSAVDLADRRGWRYTLQTVAAHLARALAKLERNDLAAAAHAARDGERAHLSDPEAAQRLVVLGVRARLATARGEHAAARELFDEARRDPPPRLRVPALDTWLALGEAQLELADDRPQLVERRAPEWLPLGAAARVCLARAAYALGNNRRAEVMLDGLAVPERDTVTRAEAGVLTALVADARGHGVRATDVLAEAVTLAAEQGIRRPFTVLASPRLDGLLQRLRMLDPATAELVDELRGGRDDAGTLAESLSARETEILRYLTTMLTAAEIAGDLGLSVNTVKAHMRAVYRKLGAGRRTEAVLAARRNGLL
ncbi:LuxR C-terminal-related transcriptional regulator [Actinoplanes sp. NPDC051513]|uniref:LuxR C-terminal-related transcriptional regulator n=1 Tax=Actinoplanes sp. NPDC051513 TaxID=3363908 RepID=UPI0037AB0BC1